MARANLLVNLFKAGIKGNVRDFQYVAESIIAEEKQKRHTVLAQRLSEIIAKSNGTLNTGRFLENGLSDYLSEITPARGLDSLILKEQSIALINELVEEQNRAELLKSHGLLPRHKIMLSGPPGNGKTALAEAIAFELMVPLLIIGYDGVIGKFLGETSSRLKKVFDYARQTRCVLFFDEFDAIGKERGDIHETGEIKRVVSTLLMQIDEMPSYTTVIVASNHANLLDSAVWRRFQIRIDMPAPTRKVKEEFIMRYGEKIGLNYGIAVRTITDRLKADSIAEVEDFCRDVLRRATLDMCRDNAKNITLAKLKQWESRHSVKAKSSA